jgi:hypothetical protein
MKNEKEFSSEVIFWAIFTAFSFGGLMMVLIASLMTA